VVAVHPYYVIRLLGGLLFLTGSLLMAFNVFRTIRGEAAKPATIEGPTGYAPAAGD